MTVKTGQAWAGTFVTLDATGALATPSVGPAGALYVDGVANAAAVTITGANPYKWSVTLPALTAGQRVEMYITATISTIATAAVVAGEQADTSLASDVGTIATAIQAKTDNLPSDPADQSLLKAEVDAVAADVWGYASRTLTQTAAQVAAVLAGSTITCQRGDTLTAALTNIGALTGYSKLWFTVKENKAHTDAQAILLLEKTAGLTVVNGAVYTTTTDGSITISDEATGDITITIKPAVTDDLPVMTGYYDIQMLTSGGVVSTLTAGTFTVTADVTRAVA